ncbi:MAG TPA: hypothetical protein VLD58_00790, partial [Gemmatimonadales bacterium]|nr:hypothetical protein [Gemmatimonadales bacterium]
MTRALACLLLIGSLLLIVCSALHPLLPLNGVGDLTMIAAMARWRWIHLGLLYGTGMIIAGIWVRWMIAPGEQRQGLAVAFSVLVIGEALNGVNIGFMAGAGTEFARLYAAGTDLSQIYQAQHLAAVMSGKLGGFLVSIAAGLIAAATARSGTEPRWMVGLALLACGAGLAGNLFAPPGHPLMLTSVGLMAVWQVGAA